MFQDRSVQSGWEAAKPIRVLCCTHAPRAAGDRAQLANSPHHDQSQKKAVLGAAARDAFGPQLQPHKTTAIITTTTTTTISVT